jgi:hypothetical protein
MKNEVLKFDEFINESLPGAIGAIKGAETNSKGDWKQQHDELIDQLSDLKFKLKKETDETKKAELQKQYDELKKKEQELLDKNA